MYHIYFNEEAVDAFALRLVQSPGFRDGTYTLYADVPVKCLEYREPFFLSGKNLSTADSRTAVQTVDFIVAKGQEVLLGITDEVMSCQSDSLFNEVLKGLPRFQFSADESHEGEYSGLYDQVMDYLREQEEAGAESAKYSLTVTSVDMTEQELKGKYLINNLGYISFFGRSHGLFWKYAISAFDSLEKYPVTANVTSDAFNTAVYWAPKGRSDDLQHLLNASITELFQDQDEQWGELQDIMGALFQLKSYPKNAPENLVGEYLELVCRMFDRCKEDNSETNEIVRLGNALLRCLATVLCDARTAERFAVLRMPPELYFEEAAVRLQQYYPKWEYQHGIRPYLNESLFYDSITLSQLLRFALDDSRQTPDLYDILVAPVCNPILLEKRNC